MTVGHGLIVRKDRKDSYVQKGRPQRQRPQRDAMVLHTTTITDTISKTSYTFSQTFVLRFKTSLTDYISQVTGHDTHAPTRLKTLGRAGRQGKGPESLKEGQISLSLFLSQNSNP